MIKINLNRAIKSPSPMRDSSIADIQAKPHTAIHPLLSLINFSFRKLDGWLFGEEITELRSKVYERFMELGGVEGFVERHNMSVVETNYALWNQVAILKLVNDEGI